MLTREEKSQIVTAVAQLVATHQVYAATQPRTAARLRETTQREMAREAAAERFLALLNGMTEDAA